MRQVKKGCNDVFFDSLIPIQMNAQMIYMGACSGLDNPENQFVDVLMDRKAKAKIFSSRTSTDTQCSDNNSRQ